MARRGHQGARPRQNFRWNRDFFSSGAAGGSIAPQGGLLAAQLVPVNEEGVTVRRMRGTVHALVAGAVTLTNIVIAAYVGPQGRSAGQLLNPLDVNTATDEGGVDLYMMYLPLDVVEATATGFLWSAFIDVKAQRKVEQGSNLYVVWQSETAVTDFHLNLSILTAPIAS